MSSQKEKLFQILALVGEVIVLIGAAIWITGWQFASVVFAVGALLFAIGRFASSPNVEGLTLRRLYAQRSFGTIILLVSAALMFVKPGFYYGMYVDKQIWLMPFIIFAVFEVYTTFRIPAVEKKEKQRK